jgi:hypothetical protein
VIRGFDHAHFHAALRQAAGATKPGEATTRQRDPRSARPWIAYLAACSDAAWAACPSDPTLGVTTVSSERAFESHASW